jgi:hypothetical protein
MTKMQKLLLTYILTLISSTILAQTIKTATLADNLLKKGNYKAAIVSYDFPSAIQELQAKALKNLKANRELSDKYIVRLVEKGAKDLTFLDAYGLTRDDFEKMLTGFKNEKKAVFTDTFNLTIQKLNGVISFKGDKRLTPFNYLTIDTRKEQITYDNNIIVREIELTGQKNFAPILFGYEASSNTEIRNMKKATKYTSAGLCIGKNTGDSRPSLCLILQSSIADFDFLNVTIL